MHIKSPAILAALLAGGVLLSGCNNQAPVAAQASSLIDNEGLARACTATEVDPATAGTNATSTMTMGNDGGWCAVRVSEAGSQAFATGLVRARPSHGRILVENTGGQTQVRYFPTAGFSGADTFTVALRSRTAAKPDLMVKVNVTVSRAS